jgi:hypothetical protein
MNTYILLLCFFAYLVMVAYVQHDMGRMKYRKAFFNTFIAPVLYPFGITVLLLVQSGITIRDKIKYRKWNDHISS